MARFDDFKELIRHSLLLKLTCDSKDAILPGLREEFNLQVNVGISHLLPETLTKLLV